MSSTVTTALEALRSLGSPAELRAAAQSIDVASARPKTDVNVHVHLPPNFSAFTTVADAVALARAQGVSVLGANNYYDYDVYGEFATLAGEAGVFPVFGLEIIALIDELLKAGVKLNDPGNPGKIYVCGKGITRFAPFSDEAMAILQVIRRNDSARMREMVEKLEQTLASRGTPTGLSESAVIDRVVRRHGSKREQVYLQERHVCQAFQEALFARLPAAGRSQAIATLLGMAKPSFGDDDAVKIQNEIRSHLLKNGKPAYVPETFIDFPRAAKLILALGGIPCYPLLADGVNPITPFEAPVATLIQNVKQLGVHAAEFIPLRNSPEVLVEYVPALRRAGLVVTAGTEHNTLDLVPVPPTALGGEPIPAKVAAIFWEGACVVVAHQFLSLHGEVGYVTASGEPNPAYPDADTRIRSLAKLGAAVLERYAERSQATGKNRP
jgi:hypothetical protein